MEPLAEYVIAANEAVARRIAGRIHCGDFPRLYTNQDAADSSHATAPAWVRKKYRVFTIPMA